MSDSTECLFDNDVTKPEQELNEVIIIDDKRWWPFRFWSLHVITCLNLYDLRRRLDFRTLPAI